MNLLIADALKAWEGAPMHIRIMAGAYVGPLLAAMVAMGERIEKLEEAQNAGK